VISPGQYRLFQADLTLVERVVEPEKMKFEDQKQTPSWRPEINDSARHCQDYFSRRLENELITIRRLKLVDDKDWADPLVELLKAMENDFKNHRAFLLRLGRYGDAETKTVAAPPKLPRIKIIGYREPVKFCNETTNIWLAEQDKTDRNLLPFGWALVEIDPETENEPLREFCKVVGPPEEGLNTRAHSQPAGLKKEQDAQERVLEAENARKAKEAAQAAKEQALASLTPEQRRSNELEEFRQGLEKQKVLDGKKAGTEEVKAVLNNAQEFLEKALKWPEAERKKCAEILLPLFKAKGMFLGAREKVFRRLLNELLHGKNNG
jgi:CRISPR-associated protein Csm5